MQVYINEVLQNIGNVNEESLVTWWKDLNNNVSLEQKIVHSIEIKNQIYYGDFDEALVYGFKKKEDVRITIVYIYEMINDLLSQMKEYLYKLLDQKEVLYRALIELLENNDWSTIKDFVEGIEWLYNISVYILFLDNQQADNRLEDLIVDFKNDIEMKIGLLNQAMQSIDTLWMQDIITYEFYPLFEKFYERLGEWNDRTFIH